MLRFSIQPVVKRKNNLDQLKTIFLLFVGQCDAYVKIRLLPEEKFVDIKLPKTHVHKETLFPLFDETFNM